MSFSASAPGSLMLLGEYAVLHGKQALVCAIDKRITVHVTPRSDDRIVISSALGTLETHLGHLESKAPFQYVLAVLMRFNRKLKTGCDIRIESMFSHQVGFGSSAAVTVALFSAVSKWLGLSFNEIQLIKEARRIIQTVQGVGSGADVAACVLGGIVAYRMKPFHAEKLSALYPLTVIYSGSKTSTSHAINTVNESFLTRPLLFQTICQGIDYCAVEGVHWVKKNNPSELANMMNIQQGFMEALGVNTPVMTEILQILKTQPKIKGAKISGAGLGDCVIALGSLSQGLSFHDAAIETIPVSMSECGLKYE